VNGVNLAVRARGEGPAILFIHGYPLDHTIWKPQLDALEGWWRIAPDLRGMGGSDAPDAGYSMAAYAEDLLALLDSLRIERVVLCGHSMGGYVGFELMRRALDRIRAVVLVATRAEADTPEGQRARDAAARSAREHGAEAIADAMLPNMLGPTALQGDPTLVATVRRVMARTPVVGLVGALAAMRDRPDSTSFLASLQHVPTLVLAGAEDRIIPVERARAMTERIPGAKLTVVPAAGHLPSLEAPEPTTAAIRAFLASLG
jgi:pimeloyl-ACP methyl ester carboxylesterase